MSSQTVLQFLKTNPRRKYHPMMLARQLNSTVAKILPIINTLKKQNSVTSVGPTCCSNMRYWGYNG